MKLKHLDGDLYEFVTKRLGKRKHSRYQKHLAECEKCRIEVIELTNTINLLNKYDTPSIPSELKEQIFLKIKESDPDPPEPFFKRIKEFLETYYINWKLIVPVVGIIVTIIFFFTVQTFFEQQGKQKSERIYRTRKALLIGINTYKNFPQTTSNLPKQIFKNPKGTLNDVNLMKKALISFYGFSENDIKILTNNQATKDKIETALYDWLLTWTNDGDLVLFYFSGIGYQVPAHKGENEIGPKTVLCSYDINPRGDKNLITNFEIIQWLQKLKKRTIVLIIDAGYSGGIISQYNKLNDFQEMILMASSGKNQGSQELSLSGGFYGAFTYALYNGMKELRNPSYKELFDHTRLMIKDNLKLSQEPQLKGKSSFLSQNFLSPLISNNKQ